MQSQGNRGRSFETAENYERNRIRTLFEQVEELIALRENQSGMGLAIKTAKNDLKIVREAFSNLGNSLPLHEFGFRGDPNTATIFMNDRLRSLYSIIRQLSKIIDKIQASSQRLMRNEGNNREGAIAPNPETLPPMEFRRHYEVKLSEIHSIEGFGDSEDSESEDAEIVNERDREIYHTQSLTSSSTRSSRNYHPGQHGRSGSISSAANSSHSSWQESAPKPGFRLSFDVERPLHPTSRARGSLSDESREPSRGFWDEASETQSSRSRGSGSSLEYNSRPSHDSSGSSGSWGNRASERKSHEAPPYGLYPGQFRLSAPTYRSTGSHGLYPQGQAHSSRDPSRLPTVADFFIPPPKVGEEDAEGPYARESNIYSATGRFGYNAPGPSRVQDSMWMPLESLSVEEEEEDPKGKGKGKGKGKAPSRSHHH